MPSSSPKRSSTFTEALIHGTLPWAAQHQRLAVLYKYSPGHSAWMRHCYDLENYPDLTEQHGTRGECASRSQAPKSGSTVAAMQAHRRQPAQAGASEAVVARVRLERMERKAGDTVQIRRGCTVIRPGLDDGDELHALTDLDEHPLPCLLSVECSGAPVCAPPGSIVVLPPSHALGQPRRKAAQPGSVAGGGESRPPTRLEPAHVPRGLSTPRQGYAPDGALVLQRAKHVTDTAFAAAQVNRFVQTGNVEANDGSWLALDAESLCIHGDGPNATEVGDAVRAALHEIGCRIAPVMA